MDRKLTTTIILAAFTLMLAASTVQAASLGSGMIQAVFMNQDPDPAIPGQYVDLRWQLIKIGGTRLENTRFKLEVEYPFYFDQGERPEKYLGDVIGGTEEEEYYILHYRLRVDSDALKGDYNVTLRYTYGRGVSWFEQDYIVHVDTSRPEFVVGLLRTSPEKLVADTTEALLKIEIDNIGDGKAENVQVKLRLPPGFQPSYSYSDQDNLGTIEEDTSKTARFYIDVDENIQDGDYPASLEIKYKEENDPENRYRTKILPLNLTIKPAPYLIVESATTRPPNPQPGDEVELLIRVKNTGNKKAEAVSLRVFKDSTQPFKFQEKSDYIGRLEPGQTGEAVLRLEIREDAAPKTYQLDTELRGIDDKENVLVFERSTPLTLYPKEKTSKLPATAAAALIALLGLAIAAIYYNSNKHK